jgi:hypothetical protein
MKDKKSCEAEKDGEKKVGKIRTRRKDGGKRVINVLVGFSSDTLPRTSSIALVVVVVEEGPCSSAPPFRRSVPCQGVMGGAGSCCKRHRSRSGSWERGERLVGRERG